MFNHAKSQVNKLKQMISLLSKTHKFMRYKPHTETHKINLLWTTR